MQLLTLLLFVVEKLPSILCRGAGIKLKVYGH